MFHTVILACDGVHATKTAPTRVGAVSIIVAGLR